VEGDIAETRSWPLSYCRRAVVPCFGAKSAASFENGRHASYSHTEPPHMGQRSGAAERLAPKEHLTHRKRCSGVRPLKRLRRSDCSILI
jgi:hypothetical protein